MEQNLSERIWRAENWDQYNFMRGQHDTAKRFTPERMLAEITQLKETLRNA